MCNFTVGSERNFFDASTYYPGTSQTDDGEHYMFYQLNPKIKI